MEKKVEDKDLIKNTSPDLEKPKKDFRYYFPSLEALMEKKDLRDFLQKEKVKPTFIIDYAEKELRTFFEKPFGEVDSLILSQLSYIHLGCIVGKIDENLPAIPISGLLKSEHFFSYLDDVRDAPKNKELLFALCASPRYRDITVNYYTNKIDILEEKQFCAMTFFLPTGEVYIAFRGTDSTVVGWKEDFNMTFISPVPSQLSAVEYLKQISLKTDKKLYLGGHSKGGNLALYSAIYGEKSIQDRIIAIFSHDGPGVKEGVFDTEGYKNISGKIHITLPKSSLVGMMFEIQEYRVVKSNRMGIMQHDPFSWEIDGDDFAYTETLTDTSIFMNQTMNIWLNSLSEEQMKTFVDTLFDVLEAAGTKSFVDWPQGAIKEADRLLKAVKDIDEETSKYIYIVIGELIKISVKNMFVSLDRADKDYSLTDESESESTDKVKV
ncbi:MAG: DUF2974 domain-containing protein [Oscillospiraceae bacterium]